MQLQRTTWVLVLIAILLGGVVYVVEGVIPQRKAQQQAGRSRIFTDLELADLRRFEIKTPQERLIIRQTQDQQAPWQMIRPERVTANRGAVQFLTNLLVEGRYDRSRSINASETTLAEYGLANPIARIRIYRHSQPQPLTLFLGDPTLDERWVYGTFADPETATGEIVIMALPIELKYAVERNLGEWIAGEERENRETD
ncbi:MAG: hypothetical protein EA366_09120 [Spirulina sp. DLM2.Bin59]|nr:MAG: hypothetical protein EA366_09120 [Spirulina sp. DLM2.Bin59]